MRQTSSNERLRNRFWIGVGLLILLANTGPAEAQLNRTLHLDGWILAAAHAPGLQGSIWRTDLWIRAHRGGGVVTLYFNRAEEDNSRVFGHEIEIGNPEKQIYIEDVVDQFLDVGNGSWVGAIRYESTTPVQVYARVYSVSEDGSASFGQVIEGIPTSDMTMPFTDDDYPGTREHQWMFALKHTADGRYRVNIGVVNPTATETSCPISIFGPDGNRPPGVGTSSFSITVPPYSLVQLSDPFGEISGGEWNNYTVRVETE